MYVFQTLGGQIFLYDSGKVLGGSSGRNFLWQIRSVSFTPRPCSLNAEYAFHGDDADNVEVELSVLSTNGPSKWATKVTSIAIFCHTFNEARISTHQTQHSGLRMLQHSIMLLIGARLEDLCKSDILHG